MARKKNPPVEQKPSLKKGHIDPTVLAAIIGATALIVSAIITYVANRTQAELPIQATQTAEARLTGVPSPTNSNITATPIVVETNIIPITLENANQIELLKEIDIETNWGKVLFSPDGKYVAYGRWDEATRIWSAKDYTFIHKLDNAGTPLLFSADSSILYTESGRTVKKWNLTTGRYAATPFWADGIAISPDETRIALCDVEKQTLEVRALDNSYTLITKELNLVLTGGSEIRCELTFSHDGSVLVVSDGIFFYVYESHFWRLADSFEGLNLSTTEFSPDGKYFGDGWYMFNTDDWSVRFELPTPDLVYKVTFTPDSKMMVTGSQESSVQFWNVQDGSLVKMIKGSNVYPSMAGLAFSPSGDLLTVVTDKIRFYGVKK